MSQARRHRGQRSSGGAARPACARPPCARRRPSCARRWRRRRCASSSRFGPANGTVTRASTEGRRRANLLRRRPSIESFLARRLLCGFISDLLLALALGLRGLGLRPAWKSNFGRPTPSTRRCLRSCVCSMAWRLISTQAPTPGASSPRALARPSSETPPSLPGCAWPASDAMSRRWRDTLHAVEPTRSPGRRRVDGVSRRQDAGSPPSRPWPRAASPWPRGPSL